MKGDRTELALDSADRQTLRNARALNVPVVAVIISGRPLDIALVLADANAVIAAWLPDREGAGVADASFGDYRPKGKLSFTWPRAVTATSVTPPDRRNALFPFEFGLG